MIRNFEVQTAPLTEEELQLVPTFVAGLKTKIGKDKAITNKDIREAFEKHPNFEIKVHDSRIRKIINHIRTEALLPLLCATSKGYYVAETHEEVYDYLKSLHERIGAQIKVYNALDNQMKKAKKDGRI